MPEEEESIRCRAMVPYTARPRHLLSCTAASLLRRNASVLLALPTPSLLFDSDGDIEARQLEKDDVQAPYLLSCPQIPSEVFPMVFQVRQHDDSRLKTDSVLC